MKKQKPLKKSKPWQTIKVEEIEDDEFGIAYDDELENYKHKGVL